MSKKTEVTGLKEVLKNFDRADKAAVKVFRKAVKASAKPVLQDAKSRVQVSVDGSHGRPPGTLRKDLTIYAEKTKDKAKYVVRVGLRRRKTAKALDQNGVPYGVFVEYGTSEMSAKPYLRPAFKEDEPETEKRIRETIMDAFMKNGTVKK